MAKSNKHEPSENGVDTMEAPGKKTTQPKGKKTVVVTLSSINPGLLMNPMTEAVINSLLGTTGAKQSNKGRPVREICEEKLMKDPVSGKLGIPTDYLLASLKAAGRLVKNGKKQISTASTTTLYSFLQMDAPFLHFDKHTEWIPSVKKGNMKNGGSSVAVPICRPLIREWEIKVPFTVDETVCDINIIRQLFIEAGDKIGVADYRPSCNGPFGRFKVTGWEVE